MQSKVEYDDVEADVEQDGARYKMLGDAFTDSLRYMGSFSQRSLKYFDETACSQQLVARRMPPVPNMMISRIDFKQNVIKEYQRVQAGEMRQIVSMTSSGKSTTLPAEIVSVTGENGLILSPRADLSYYNGAFLAEKFLPDNYPGVSAVQLRSEHVKHPVKGKVLYYDVSASFFMMLAIYPTLLQKLSIKFILFDESHEATGDYKFSELLASAGKFRDVKVMLVSATKGDANMEQEADSGRRKIKDKDPALMDLGNIWSLGSNSPLHYTQINNRVLIFCPDYDCIEGAKDYYIKNDIPVMVYNSFSSSIGLVQLKEFLSENVVCAVLTDRVLETGFTFDFEDAIDCGYTSDLRIDLDNRMVDLVKRPVTMAERQQRGGRVGRMNPGTFYFSNIESTPSSGALSDSSACYLALWCHLYNMTTNLAEVQKYKKFFGPISHRKVMKLLHCHVHPVLAHAYMDLIGNMCHGWQKVFNHAVRKTEFGESKDSKLEEIEADWVHQNIYDQRFVSELESIKVPMSVPEDWAPFFYAVWKVTDTAGRRWPFDHKFDRRSVLSVVPADRLRKKGTVHRPSLPRDSSATLALDSRSIGRTMLKNNFPVVSPVVEIDEQVFVPEVPAESSEPLELVPTINALAVKELPPLPTSPRRASVASVKLSGLPTHTRTASLSKLVTKAGKAPVSEMKSPGSAPSLDDYRQVRATTLHIEKVYPYSVDLLGVYLSNTSRKDVDMDRVHDMVDFRVKIYDMALEVKQRYLLSLVRCWNYAVTAISQLSARPDRPSIFRSRSGRQISGFESDLESYKALLVTFERERFKFAVRRSTRHSSTPGPPIEVRSTLVSDRLDYIQGALHVLKVDGRRRGLYLHDADCTLGVLHVFENNDRIDRPHDAMVIRFARKDDLVIMGSVSHPDVGITQLVRQPVDGERVYIITVLSTGEYRVFSGIQIAYFAGKWFHTAEGEPGMSSAPIVGADDGKLLGLHVGGSLTFSDYKGMMAPLFEFIGGDTN